MKTVNIKGNIVSNNDQYIYDWIGYEAVSPKKVEEEINAAKGDDLEVIISSPGGDVLAGSEIYTTFKSYPKNVTVKIIAMAASAASVVAMAGKTILMSPTASMMIHNASGYNGGDYRSMEHMAGVLKNINKTIANAYRIKTGKSQKELLDLMDKETWFTPQQALSYGFIDAIMFEDQFNTKAQSQAQLDKLKTGNRQNNAKVIAQAQLNLLKLKGDKRHE